MHRVLVALPALGLALASFGQVTSIPPFAGAKSESFELFGQSSMGCWPARVFENSADLCANYQMYSGLWSWSWSAFGQCYLYPHHANRQLVIHEAQFDIHFDTPVWRFGGWFSRVLDPINANEVFEFYDDQGTLIGTESFLIPVGCHWQWYGWQAVGAPIGSIRVNGVSPLGAFILLDDLQADFVPPSPPSVYCTAGTTSNGCVPSITASANPSVAHTTPCQISISGVEGQRTGIVFYGLSPLTAPWCVAGGTSTLCVKAPIMRTGVQSSGGTFQACDGSLALDWNAFQLANTNALGAPWSVGNKAFVQGWFRDPPSCKTTNLSDAIELTYAP